MSKSGDTYDSFSFNWDFNNIIEPAVPHMFKIYVFVILLINDNLVQTIPNCKTLKNINENMLNPKI